MSKPNKGYRSWLLILVVSAIANGSLHAQQVLESITIEDLVSRVQIPLISLAPDGSQVAYLSVKGLPLENLYEITLNLQPADGQSEPRLLHRYHLPPDQVFDKDTGALLTAAGQVIWSPDSTELAYSSHVGLGMEVRVRAIKSGLERVLVKGFDRIEITPTGSHVGIVTTTATAAETAGGTEPQDLSILVKDGYRFYGPLSESRPHTEYLIQHWKYIWGGATITKTQEPDSLSYIGLPEEWVEAQVVKTPDTYTYRRTEIVSPSGAMAAVVENSARNLQDPTLAYRASQIVVMDLRNKEQAPRILVTPERPRAVLRIVGWSADGKELYYVSVGPTSSSLNAVSVNGIIRQIHKEESDFSLPTASSEISDDRRILVLIRTTNTMPDELVKIDLQTGTSSVLASPNETFKTKAQPKVRFMPVECCGADFYGRLYLPVDYNRTKKYPLVFTNYVSNPGFDASTGDEVPILALLEHGIAVFAMNSREANILSTSGDFRVEINRVVKPLRAMEWIYHKLADEGIIDTSKCGLTGLSYGAEIAMYGYWKSNIFRAVSVSTGSWEPVDYVLGGIPYSKHLDSRGFALPADGTYTKWKELSAGLNVRPDLPPLLLQSPDGEEYGSVETWFRLRRIGLPVEWFVYAGEGHVKRSPANKWWVYRRNLDWFRFWLQGDEDPDPAKKDQYARWRELRASKAQ